MNILGSCRSPLPSHCLSEGTYFADRPLAGGVPSDPAMLGGPPTTKLKVSGIYSLLQIEAAAHGQDILPLSGNSLVLPRLPA